MQFNHAEVGLLLIAIACVFCLFAQEAATDEGGRRTMRYTSGDKAKAEAWQKQLRTKLAELLKITDLLAGETANPLNPKTISSEDKGKYVMHEMEINTTPTRRIKIVLTLPKNAQGPFPAIVAVAGHGGDRHTCYVKASYKQCAHVLAERGYVTISTRVSQHEVYEKGRTLMGERLWDLMRCADYLASREDVDAKRIGCLGNSLGGEMVMWLAAMDQRMTASVSSGFLTRMDQMEKNHCMCWKFPGLRELVDFADIYAMIAPRALLCQNGLKEPASQFPVPLAREAMEDIKPIYRDFGEPDNVALVAHEGGHEIHLPSLLAFFEKHLRGAKSEARQVPAELPTNNDPTLQIRFASVEEATARREKLIRFIWPGGLPDSQPTVTKNVDEAAVKQHLKGVDRSLVKQIDRLELDVLGIGSLAYLIHPVKSSETARLAIVHAGHSRPGDFIKRDYHDSIHLFLRMGFAVVMMHMPQHGWHDDATAELPNGKMPNVGISEGHAAIVNLPTQDSSLAPGAGFQPFLEPVIACVNHWFDINGRETDVVMIGLSGGGWTTHMAAAVDTRICLSFPVAGSFPLYLRNKDRGSVGDLEQFFSPLYNENIAPDGSGGGVATWLEIYSLGGFGEGRRQVMVTGQYDSCCFRGDPEKTVNTFRDVVADRVKLLGQGQWEHKLDTTHRGHMISPWIIDEVVAPIVHDLCHVGKQAVAIADKRHR